MTRRCNKGWDGLPIPERDMGCVATAETKNGVTFFIQQRASQGDSDECWAYKARVKFGPWPTVEEGIAAIEACEYPPGPVA